MKARHYLDLHFRTGQDPSLMLQFEFYFLISPVIVRIVFRGNYDVPHYGSIKFIFAVLSVVRSFTMNTPVLQF